jgi:hypothetical protein
MSHVLVLKSGSREFDFILSIDPAMSRAPSISYLLLYIPKCTHLLRLLTLAIGLSALSLFGIDGRSCIWSSRRYTLHVSQKRARVGDCLSMSADIALH